jgi:protein-S-isoprenylcysteine O-methyltransferase Ste14
MNTETLFRILPPLVIVAFVLHRGYYIKYRSQHGVETVKQREEGTLSRIAGLLGVAGFVSMVAYVINPDWLSFASLPFPGWVRWTGVGIAMLGFVLLQWAQVTLADSWSDTPRMMKGQTLITSGPYRMIRHPIYTAFILILGSTLLISSNGLIGLFWAGMVTLEVFSRIGFEESLMIEFFGGQYREYMKKTGRLLPRINW